MRHMHQTVAAPVIPLHQMGTLGRGRQVHVRRNHKLGASVHAPSVPLYQLGQLGAAAQLVAASAPIAAAATTAAVSAFTAAGSWAGPIGAGVGAIVGIVAGLLAGHELRAKQARNENSAVNIGISGFDTDLKQVWSAYKSGQISANDLLTQAIPAVVQGYWTVVTPQIQPGRNGCAGGASCPAYNPPANMCQGDIGAACCIGCANFAPSINGPNGVIAAIQGMSGSTQGPYVAEISRIGSSSYGTAARAAYTLDFTPPAAPAGSVTGALASLTGGSGGSLLPLLLIGGVLFLVSR